MKYVVITKVNVSDPRKSYSVYYPAEVVTIDYMNSLLEDNEFISNVNYTDKEE